MSKRRPLGQTLRALREQRGLSQAGLALRTGLSQQAISRIEQAPAGAMVRDDHLVTICEALGARPRDVLDQSAVSLDSAASRRLDHYLMWRVRQAIRPDTVDLVAGLSRQVAFAEQLRKMGHTAEALERVRAITIQLRPVVTGRPCDVELATVLLEADDLMAALTIEHFTGEVVRVVEGICREMAALGDGILGLDASECLARARIRLAEAYLVSGERRLLAPGLAASEQGSTLTRVPETRLHALGARAAILRRLGRHVTVEEIAEQIDDEVREGGVTPSSVSLVHQGLSINLAARPASRRQRGHERLGLAQDAYERSAAAYGADTHMLSLLHRSRALLYAVAGPDCDLEAARASAEQGLALAMAGEWRRTALHCQLVLDAAQQRQPLTEFPT